MAIETDVKIKKGDMVKLETGEEVEVVEVLSKMGFSKVGLIELFVKNIKNEKFQTSGNFIEPVITGRGIKFFPEISKNDKIYSDVLNLLDTQVEAYKERGADVKISHINFLINKGRVKVLEEELKKLPQNFRLTDNHNAVNL